MRKLDYRWQMGLAMPNLAQTSKDWPNRACLVQAHLGVWPDLAWPRTAPVYGPFIKELAHRHTFNSPFLMAVDNIICNPSPHYLL